MPAIRSLRQVITPKRLSRRMRDEARPFEPALLTPLLVIVLTAVADILTPHLQFYRLFGAAPALAAAMFPVAGTLGIGLLALMTGFALSAADHDLGQTPGNFTLLAITAITLAAAYASRVRQHREHTLAEVRAVAETTQKVLLRPVPHHLGQVDVEVLYQAAAAHARIGGDFYEAQQTPHGVRLIIGDVRGNGLPAVEAASVLLSFFRVHVRDAPDLPSLAGRLEAGMIDYCEDVPGDDALERFVTILLVEIPAEEPIARLLNCGHPPPLLLHDGEVHEVEPSAPSPPINMTGLLGDHYQVDAIPFATGDRLLLYTDGVSETRDHTGTFYPLTHRVRRWTSAPPRQLLDHLHQDLLAYVAGTRDDDLAALVAHRVAPEDREPRTQLGRGVRIQRIDRQSARSGGRAAGSLLKEAGAEELLGAARGVGAGATCVQPAMGARLDVADHGTAGAESADGSDTIPAVRNTPPRRDGRGGQH
ncbi:PP2C family protein-serine/threonine phosphatase [Actinacidiphila oryziradicis]|nr:PP2C family protein-serine/threonine phosphatase [Actinacidiphila oryziradicis]